MGLLSFNLCAMVQRILNKNRGHRKRASNAISFCFRNSRRYGEGHGCPVRPLRPPILKEHRTMRANKSPTNGNLLPNTGTGFHRIEPGLGSFKKKTVQPHSFDCMVCSNVRSAPIQSKYFFGYTKLGRFKSNEKEVGLFLFSHSHVVAGSFSQPLKSHLQKRLPSV